MTSGIVGFGSVITKYLIESPSDNRTRLSRRATLYNVASKTALVAAILIAAAAMAIVLTGLTLTGTASLGFLAAILIAPLLMHLSGKWGEKSMDAESKAQIEGHVESILKEISEWSDPDLRNYFQQQGIPFLDPVDPKERLVLIARFAFWKERATQTNQTALLHLDKSSPNNFIEKIDSQRSNTEESDRLRYEIRNVGFTIFETETLPAILQSALMLQLIANPFQELEISSIGCMTPKPMPYRLAERMFDKQDIFLSFHDASRRPMGCQEIAALFSESSNAVRQRMFD